MVSTRHTTSSTTGFNLSSDDCTITYEDTPIPLGECSAVLYQDTLLAVGGRAISQEGETTIHANIHTLDLSNSRGNWRSDLLPPLPTPRFNCATTLAQVNGEDHLFVIGGRSAGGLSKKVESLNLNTLEWRTDWTDL
jgi:hypothetical protein